jgi:enolase
MNQGGFMGIHILHLVGREILDSRGNPTLEVDLGTAKGWFRASVPSGASTGSHEALELRDRESSRYLGKGVQICIRHIQNRLDPAIQKLTFSSAREVDQWLIEQDGSENKTNLGGNTLLAVSMAAHRAFASLANQPLFEYLNKTYFGSRSMTTPTPFMNVINGGKHADNGIQIQEFMIVPHFRNQQKSVHDKVRAGVEIYHHLKKQLSQAGHSTNVGDEGGFAPGLHHEHEAMDFILEAIRKAGYQVGSDVGLALDIAATEFYRNEKYFLHGPAEPLSAQALCEYYVKLLDDYPEIMSIEDPLAEDDWEGWRELSAAVKSRGRQLFLVGDDLLVTNPKRLNQAIERSACNAVLVKMNQIGTVSETIDTLNLALKADWQAIISHRSGETEDPYIAHLVTASGVEWLKAGAPCRSDRNCKYNELFRIYGNKNI